MSTDERGSSLGSSRGSQLHLLLKAAVLYLWPAASFRGVFACGKSVMMKGGEKGSGWRVYFFPGLLFHASRETCGSSQVCNRREAPIFRVFLTPDLIPQLHTANLTISSSVHDRLGNVRSSHHVSWKVCKCAEMCVSRLLRQRLFRSSVALQVQNVQPFKLVEL